MVDGRAEVRLRDAAARLTFRHVGFQPFLVPARAELARIVRQGFRVFRRAFDDPGGQERQELMHHLVRDLMGERLLFEGGFLEPGLALHLKAEPLKRDAEDAVASEINTARVRRAAIGDVVITRDIELGLVVSEISRGLRLDAPRQGAHERACGLEDDGDFLHRIDRKFVLRDELKGL